MSGLREGGDWGWGSTYCCRRRASVRSLRVVCRVRPVRVHGHAILGWTPSCSRRGSRRRRRVGREGGQAVALRNPRPQEIRRVLLLSLCPLLSLPLSKLQECRTLPPRRSSRSTRPQISLGSEPPSTPSSQPPSQPSSSTHPTPTSPDRSATSSRTCVSFLPHYPTRLELAKLILSGSRP